jgi:hypothetical protein
MQPTVASSLSQNIVREANLVPFKFRQALSTGLFPQHTTLLRSTSSVAKRAIAQVA